MSDKKWVYLFDEVKDAEEHANRHPGPAIFHNHHRSMQ
jgi:hypothetical protein